jgi:uncharacterized protein involved in exopolysaccharide biosynthesis
MHPNQMTQISPHAPEQQTDSLDVAAILQKLLQGWLRIAITALIVTLLATIEVFVVTPTYEAQVVMLVSSDENSKLEGLSGIASQFGLGALGLGSDWQSNRKAEALATLQSRVLTQTYVREKNLLPILFDSNWDKASSRWKPDLSHEPTYWDANDLFSRRIRKVNEDRKTNIITLTIAWKDRYLAAQWANDLVARTNAYLRQKALDQSERNLTYLDAELKRTNLIEAQQAIYKLVENELKTTMLARGNEQYAFTVVDPAVVPQKPTSPRRLLTITLALFGGLALGSIWVLMRHPPTEPDSITRAD